MSKTKKEPHKKVNKILSALIKGVQNKDLPDRTEIPQSMISKYIKVLKLAGKITSERTMGKGGEVKHTVIDSIFLSAEDYKRATKNNAHLKPLKPNKVTKIKSSETQLPADIETLLPPGVDFPLSSSKLSSDDIIIQGSPIALGEFFRQLCKGGIK